MTSLPGVRLVRAELQHRPRAVRVIEVTDLTPTYRRITMAGDFSDFASLGADDHLRLFVVPADAVLDEDPDVRLAQLREHPSREFTPVAWDAGSLTLDFVLHGEGPASTWAATAVPGSLAATGGPRGSLVIEGAPDWWLLAGDRTALPAIRRYLGLVAPGTPVDVLLIAEDPADEQSLESAGELTVTWCRSQAELVESLPAVPAREGEGFAFIAAEQSIVKSGREFLAARGHSLERAVVKGYWKRDGAEDHTAH